MIEELVVVEFEGVIKESREWQKKRWWERKRWCENSVKERNEMNTEWSKVCCFTVYCFIWKKMRLLQDLHVLDEIPLSFWVIDLLWIKFDQSSKSNKGVNKTNGLYDVINLFLRRIQMVIFLGIFMPKNDICRKLEKKYSLFLVDLPRFPIYIKCKVE